MFLKLLFKEKKKSMSANLLKYLTIAKYTIHFLISVIFFQYFSIKSTGIYATYFSFKLKNSAMSEQVKRLHCKSFISEDKYHKLIQSNIFFMSPIGSKEIKYLSNLLSLSQEIIFYA